MLKIRVFACFAIIALLIGACSKKVIPLSAVELLDLGEKYLLELDYEQAIVQFLNVIEIEPKNPRAYLGAAEAYAALGETKKAVDVLQKGLEATGNAEIAAKLAEIEDVITLQPYDNSLKADMLKIVSISPKTFIDSVETTFSVTIEYSLKSMSDCALNILANEVFDNSHNGSSYAYLITFPLTESAGILTFQLTCVPKMWDDYPFAIWAAIHGEQQPELEDIYRFESNQAIVNASETTPKPTPQIGKSIYSDIVSAFKTYEDSGWHEFGSPLIADSFLVIPQIEWGVTPENWDPSMAGTGFDINEVNLQYSLCDISGDGIPELFIGTETYSTYSNQYYYDIFGIYSVVNGSAVSVFQKVFSRDYITLYDDNTFEAVWGHSGVGDYARYAIGVNGELQTVYSLSYSEYDANGQLRFDEYGEITAIYTDEFGNEISAGEAESLFNSHSYTLLDLDWHILADFFR